MRHQSTTTIDAPIDEVWRAIRDVEKWSDWTPTVDEIHLHAGDELRLGGVATVRQPKQPAREWTVTELDDGRSFTWTTSSPGLRFSADHTVTTANGTTTVELTFAVAGPLAPLAGLLGGRAIRTAVDIEAASLKKWCERTSR
ncbi:SRPBCC family protein [Actinophytocola sp.]|uniref:SRPBCC family protein n=1 Tax=Actinophytocola sp. TaxID=1872138 RepID=UPI00389AEC80